MHFDFRQYHAFVNAIAMDPYHGSVTPLDYALQSSNELLVDYLRQHGALTGKERGMSLVVPIGL